jgi:hypothetical protein
MISESHKGEPTEARGSPLIVDSALNLRGAIRAAVEASPVLRHGNTLESRQPLGKESFAPWPDQWSLNHLPTRPTRWSCLQPK